jgi:hypothetical protein
MQNSFDLVSCASLPRFLCEARMVLRPMQIVKRRHERRFLVGATIDAPPRPVEQQYKRRSELSKAKRCEGVPAIPGFALFRLCNGLAWGELR